LLLAAKNASEICFCEQRPKEARNFLSLAIAALEDIISAGTELNPDDVMRREEEEIFHLRCTLATLLSRDRLMDDAIEQGETLLSRTRQVFTEQSPEGCRALLLLGRFYRDDSDFVSAKELADRARTVAAVLVEQGHEREEDQRNAEQLFEESKDLLAEMLAKLGKDDMWDDQDADARSKESFRPPASHRQQSLPTS
jgi:lipopolysaccharide biosynthesis regulator YciM